MQKSYFGSLELCHGHDLWPLVTASTRLDFPRRTDFDFLRSCFLDYTNPHRQDKQVRKLRLTRTRISSWYFRLHIDHHCVGLNTRCSLMRCLRPPRLHELRTCGCQDFTRASPSSTKVPKGHLVRARLCKAAQDVYHVSNIRHLFLAAAVAWHAWSQSSGGWAPCCAVYLNFRISGFITLNTCFSFTSFWQVRLLMFAPFGNLRRIFDSGVISLPCIHATVGKWSYRLSVHITND